MDASASLSVTGLSATGSPAKSPSKDHDLLTAEQAWAILEQKFSSRYRSVHAAFTALDVDKDGQVSQKEFRDHLEVLGVRLGGREFRKLWRMFDANGDGRLKFAEFNNLIGGLIKPYSMGLQMKRPETPTMKEWQRKSMAQRLRRKVHDIEETFHEVDTDGSGRISHAEFIQCLRKMGIRGVGDQESFSMMQRHRKADNFTGQMTFDEFKACMMDYMKVPGDALSGDGAEEILAQAERLIAGFIPRTSSANAIKVLRQYDADGYGDLSYDQFRRMLSTNGVNLSDAQWELVTHKYDPIGDGTFGITEFVGVFTAGHEVAPAPVAPPSDFKPWARLGLRPVLDAGTARPTERRRMPGLVGPRLGLTDTEIRIVLCLVGREGDFVAACQERDGGHSGQITRADFRQVLDSLEVEVEPTALSTIVSKFDTAKTGKVSYNDFAKWARPYLALTPANLARLMLERVATAADQRAPSAGAAAPVSASKPATPRAIVAAAAPAASPAVVRGGASSSSAAAAAAADDDDAVSLPTAAIDLNATAARMRKVLGKSWTTVASELAKKPRSPLASAGTAVVSPSKADAGAVAPDRFRDVLAKHGVALTSKEVKALSSRYAKGEGMIDLATMLKETF